MIIAENCKNNKNFESELGNLTEAHNLYLQKRERAANQEFNYFTNLLPKFISKLFRKSRFVLFLVERILCSFAFGFVVFWVLYVCGTLYITASINGTRAWTSGTRFSTSASWAPLFKWDESTGLSAVRDFQWRALKFWNWKYYIEAKFSKFLYFMAKKMSFHPWKW